MVRVDELDITAQAKLVEQLDLTGRKSEFRQLIKALALCRAGQGKAILVLGSEGIGKSALIDRFATLTEATGTTRTLRLTLGVSVSPPIIFAQWINALLTLAHEILGESLEQINQTLAPLGLRWSQRDLVQMVALSGLQGEHAHQTGHEAVAQLGQAIRHALPFFKRFDKAVQADIDAVARVLLDPWTRLAVALANPMNLPVQRATYLVERIVGLPVQTGFQPLLEGAAAMPQLPSSAEVESDAPGSFTTDSPMMDGEALDAEPDALASGDITPENLLRVLGDLFRFINPILSVNQDVLVTVIDHWERLVEGDSPQAALTQAFLADVIRQIYDQRDTRLMLMLAARTENASYTLGGGLFNALKTKLLLTPLTAGQVEQWLESQLSALGASADTTSREALVALCQGNPAWMKLVWHHTAGVIADLPQPAMLTAAAYQERLAVAHPQDLLDMMWNRLFLSNTGDEAALNTVLTQLAWTIGSRPFVTVELAGMVGDLSPVWLSDVLTQLKTLGWLVTLDKGEYQIPNAFLLSSIRNRIKPPSRQEAKHDKIEALKKVLPVSFQAGELTPAKTQELLSMVATLEAPELLDVIEDGMLEALKNIGLSDDARIGLLQSLTLLATERAALALINELSVVDPVIQQVALEGLVEILPRHSHLMDGQTLTENILPLTRHSEESLAQAAFALCGVWRGSPEQIEQALLGGLSSTSWRIQVQSMHALARRQTQQPALLKALMDSLSEVSAEPVFTVSLEILQRLPATLSLAPLKAFLNQSDASSPRWQAALNALMTVDFQAALPWLSPLLLNPSTAVDHRLSILKKLGSRPNSQAEQLLCDVLGPSHLPGLTPELVWMAVRSLGWIAFNPTSLVVLESLVSSGHKWDPIVMQALASAQQQIRERLGASVPEPRDQALALSSTESTVELY